MSCFILFFIIYLSGFILFYFFNKGLIVAHTNLELTI